MGKRCLFRQSWTRLVVVETGQKRVVELTLFASSLLALVHLHLLIAEALEGLAFASSLLEDLLLLVAQVLHAGKLAEQIDSLSLERRFCDVREIKFGGGCAGGKFASRADLYLADARIHSVDQMADFRHLLIRSAQARLLLMLHALPEVKNSLQWKAKSHRYQAGSASNREILSDMEADSAGFCIKKRCNSGMSASALSSVGSLPF